MSLKTAYSDTIRQIYGYCHLLLKSRQPCPTMHHQLDDAQARSHGRGGGGGHGRHLPPKNFQDRLNFFRPLPRTSINYMYVPPPPPPTSNSGYGSDGARDDASVHEPELDILHAFTERWRNRKNITAVVAMTVKYPAVNILNAHNTLKSPC